MDQFTQKKKVRGAMGWRRYYMARGKNSEGQPRWIVWERISLIKSQVRGVWTTKAKAKWHIKKLNQRLGQMPVEDK